jgi:hypothetical protein
MQSTRKLFRFAHAHTHAETSAQRMSELRVATRATVSYQPDDWLPFATYNAQARFMHVNYKKYFFYKEKFDLSLNAMRACIAELRESTDAAGSCLCNVCVRACACVCARAIDC